MKLSLSMPRLTIGELAKRAGVGVETVRYYHRMRLLPMPPRRHGGIREYPPEALRMLRFIRRMKGLGFSLREISSLLQLRAARKHSREEVARRFGQKLVELEKKARALEITRAVLERLVAECEQEGDGDEPCRTFEDLYAGEDHGGAGDSLVEAPTR